MFYYNAYGLNIRSEIPLPELRRNINYIRDVNIIYGDIDLSDEEFTDSNFGKNSKFRISGKGLHFILDDIYICRISFGKEIVINPDTGFDESFLRAIILGPALSFLLHQRGNLILHASAVNINNEAIAFIGKNGAGKSTILCALHNEGYPIITDDSLPIIYNDEYLPIVTPTYSRLKLRNDVMEYLHGNLDSTLKTHIYSEKYSYSADDNFSYKELYLKKIYIIEKGERTGFNSLNHMESLMKLIESSYCYEIFNKNDLAENMLKCSKIVSNVPIKVLKVKHSLSQLSELSKIIENDNLNLIREGLVH